ncbi:hypothetical protein BKA62DRAFT_669799 [Auriculariales sp. MPI-PUGE-AT-0066]|nr:hypothetical protein BKA62DRAFT_669799 [Auriculariales sp. MPI-PUGE-AT-0066]
MADIVAGKAFVITAEHQAMIAALLQGVAADNIRTDLVTDRRDLDTDQAAPRPNVSSRARGNRALVAGRAVLNDEAVAAIQTYADAQPKAKYRSDTWNRRLIDAYCSFEQYMALYAKDVNSSSYWTSENLLKHAVLTPGIDGPRIKARTLITWMDGLLNAIFQYAHVSPNDKTAAGKVIPKKRTGRKQKPKPAQTISPEQRESMLSTALELAREKVKSDQIRLAQTRADKALQQKQIELLTAQALQAHSVAHVANALAQVAPKLTMSSDEVRQWIEEKCFTAAQEKFQQLAEALRVLEPVARTEQLRAEARVLDKRKDLVESLASRLVNPENINILEKALDDESDVTRQRVQVDLLSAQADYIDRRDRYYSSITRRSKSTMEAALNGMLCFTWQMLDNVVNMIRAVVPGAPEAIDRAYDGANTQRTDV